MSQINQIKAIIFDFDGLILDTETPEFTAWQELYREYGCELPLNVWADCIGRPHGYFDPYQYLMDLTGRKLDRESLRIRRRARTNELIADEHAMPGVRQYLAQAKASHIRLAVASSSTKEWVTGHLRRLDLLDAFSVITCAQHTTRHKPDPEPYLHTLRLLGLSACEAIALEDSPNGVQAARSAKLFCAAVANPVTRLLDLSHANLVIQSLCDTSLDELLELASASHSTSL